MSAAWGVDVSDIKLHLMKLRKQVYGNYAVFVEWNWECVLRMFVYVVQTAKLFVQKTVLVCIYSSLILNWASSTKKLYVEACLQNINKWLLHLMCDISQLASPCLSICPCIIVEQLGLHCTDLQEIWHSHIFRKSFEKIQVLLKSDKNNWYFTWAPMHFLMIHLWFLI